MSKIPENQINPPDSATIFDAPAEHHDKARKTGKKKQLLAVILGLLAVGVLVGGTLAVIKLVPKKEETSSETNFPDISVLDYSADDFEVITVRSHNKTVKLYSEKDESANTQSWYIDGIAKENVDSYSVGQIAETALKISAIREITEKSSAECGLDDPVIQIDATSRKHGKRSVLIGTESPDHTGTYLKLSDLNQIYLVDTAIADTLDFDLLDLADDSQISAMTFKDEKNKYTDESGKLISFDSLILDGKNFKVPVVIQPDNNSELSAYLPYKIVSPVKRTADHVDQVFPLFSDGMAVSGAYSFDISADSLKAVGLDRPDWTITIKCGKQTRTYKIAKTDNESCAVIADDSTMIKKVSIDAIPFLDYTSESFYNRMIYLRSINTVSEFKVELEGKQYDFSIQYDDAEDAAETYIIHCNGTKLDAAAFQNFYQTFVSLCFSDYDVHKTDAKADLTITVTSSKTGATDILSYTKGGETKYQYSLNGNPEGRLTASSFTKFIKQLRSVIADIKPV